MFCCHSGDFSTGLNYFIRGVENAQIGAGAGVSTGRGRSAGHVDGAAFITAVMHDARRSRRGCAGKSRDANRKVAAKRGGVGEVSCTTENHAGTTVQNGCGDGGGTTVQARRHGAEPWGAEPRCGTTVWNHGAEPRGGTPGGSDARTPRARPQSRSRRTERHRRAYKPAPRRHRRRGNAKGQVISYLASLVGLPGLEPGTSSLSVKRSNHLSYSPVSNYVRNLIEITRSWRVSRIERGVR